ncbi:MAG TPA: phosphatase PAP2 family protein [Acidimicrobiales bacterium]|nr:phosphatase PAP2 family protein [Acidimicrobiales bacterium]
MSPRDAGPSARPTKDADDDDGPASAAAGPADTTRAPPNGATTTAVGTTAASATGTSGTDGDAGPAADGPRGPALARLMGLRWWHELAYIVLVYVGYSTVRNQFGSGAGDAVDPEPAFHHGEAIIQLERNIGLYVEEAIQSWYLDLPADGLIRAWNVYYGIFHFIVPTIALIWLYRAAPERYRVWRNTLATTTLVALVGFASFSLMPPRLMDDPGIYGGCQVYAGEDAADALHEAGGAAGDAPCDEFGYIDTVAVHGGWASFGSDEMAAVSNQYAAMPSMHIGWSTWCAIVLFSLAKRRWVQALAIAYPFVTLFDIVVTGNHYWIDGLGGLACLAVGFALSKLATDRYETWSADRRAQRTAAEAVVTA